MFIGLGFKITNWRRRISDDGSPYVVTDYVVTDYVQEAP